LSGLQCCIAQISGADNPIGLFTEPRRLPAGPHDATVMWQFSDKRLNF